MSSSQAQEGELQSLPCGLGDGLYEGTSFLQVRSYGVYAQTLRDVHPIGGADPNARVWDSRSRFQFIQIEVCASPRHFCVLGIQVHCGILVWASSWCSDVSRKNGIPDADVDNDGNSCRVRGMTVQMERVSFFPSG